MRRVASTRAPLKSSGFSWKRASARLIDSYADGILDKANFEPKIQQLKNRLEQIEQQIAGITAPRSGAESELFLVIKSVGGVCRRHYRKTGHD